ncbi:MAG: hypothetical protein LBR85_04525 [Oscillospiraceae bacterium]|nr:hypothetical protein [Oscillospiraceae bacterium]
MRKTAIVLSIALCAAILMGVAGVIATGDGLWFQSEEKTDAYQFPVYEGESGRPYAEIVNSLQIPEDKLRAMSTEGLVETCMNYPLFALGIYTSNESMYAGFMKTRKEFNGLEALFKREDAQKILVGKFLKVNLKELANGADDFSILRLRYLEYILAQDEILKSLTPEERQILTDTCQKMIAEKVEKYKDVFSIDSTLLIAARIQVLDNPEFAEYAQSNKKIKYFIERGVQPYLEVEEVEEILQILNISLEG